MSTPVCPFTVGQRIHEVYYPPYLQTVGSIEDLTSTHCIMVDPDLDPTKPHATVMALTERGFTYRYDARVPIGPARWGSWTEEGECFAEGYHMWAAIPE